ncbi:MAG TPA: hypothetical protein VD997_03265 [Phycisphaerales bacterium]|nr:hypothetical protein [Phycisphaerales bacterium]
MSKRISLLLLCVSGLLLPACEEKHESPEATIAALRASVEQGRADKIPNYLYADTPEMRKLLTRFGKLLGNLQKLGTAVATKFPKEVGELKAKAEAAAKDGKSSSFLSQMMAQQRGGRRNVAVQVGGSSPQSRDKMRDAFNDTMKQLFADPYGWIQRSEQRLSTEFLTDESVAVLWDGEPVLAPIGMVMKRDQRDGNWYFVIPTNIPGMNRILPKSEREYQIWGGLITVFDKMIVDLTKEVENGTIKSIDELSFKAGEMAFMPAMLTVYAYTQLKDAEKKEAKAAEAKASAPAVPGK